MSDGSLGGLGDSRHQAGVFVSFVRSGAACLPGLHSLSFRGQTAPWFVAHGTCRSGLYMIEAFEGSNASNGG